MVTAVKGQMLVGRNCRYGIIVNTRKPQKSQPFEPVGVAVYVPGVDGLTVPGYGSCEGQRPRLVVRTGRCWQHRGWSVTTGVATGRARGVTE